MVDKKALSRSATTTLITVFNISWNRFYDMKNWKYYELIAIYFSNYFLFVEQGANLDIADARTIDEFWFYSEHNNIVPNLISIIQNLNIQISLLKKANKGSIDLFTKQLSLLDEDLLKAELNSEEIELLHEAINELIIKLDIRKEVNKILKYNSTRRIKNCINNYEFEFCHLGIWTRRMSCNFSLGRIYNKV